MLHSWAPVVRLRNAARSIGLTRFLARLRNSSKYEERFGKAMFDALRPGDTVWDVGANVGYYTQQFSTAVGDSGRVVAFEPVPACYRQLVQAVEGRSNVRLVHAGLGRAAGTVAFDVGDGSVSSVSRIVEDTPSAAGGQVMHLPIYMGDQAVESQGLPRPTFAKIDVEGYELDVLEGMRSLLGSPSCRNVFVEIHFGLLNQRGMADAPDAIVRLLRELGYQVRWVDPSHVHAARS